MNILFYSDPHFFHSGVIKYCTRPFNSVEEMNEELIKRYNQLVGDEDLVYWLGDISFGKFSEAEKIFSRLRGRRVLIQGNHDKYSATQYRKLGFEVICLEMKLNIAGYSVRMSHYPYKSPDPRYQERLPKDHGDWLLHGHVHQHWKVRGREINCGVDVWDFYPVRQAQIESILMKGSDSPK